MKKALALILSLAMVLCLIPSLTMARIESPWYRVGYSYTDDSNRVIDGKDCVAVDVFCLLPEGYRFSSGHIDISYDEDKLTYVCNSQDLGVYSLGEENPWQINAEEAGVIRAAAATGVGATFEAGTIFTLYFEYDLEWGEVTELFVGNEYLSMVDADEAIVDESAYGVNTMSGYIACGHYEAVILYGNDENGYDILVDLYTDQDGKLIEVEYMGDAPEGASYVDSCYKYNVYIEGLDQYGLSSFKADIVYDDDALRYVANSQDMGVYAYGEEQPLNINPATGGHILVNGAFAHGQNYNGVLLTVYFANADAGIPQGNSTPIDPFMLFESDSVTLVDLAQETEPLIPDTLWGCYSLRGYINMAPDYFYIADNAIVYADMTTEEDGSHLLKYDIDVSRLNGFAISSLSIGLAYDTEALTYVRYESAFEWQINATIEGGMLAAAATGEPVLEGNPVLSLYFEVSKDIEEGTILPVTFTKTKLGLCDADNAIIDEEGYSVGGVDGTVTVHVYTADLEAALADAAEYMASDAFSALTAEDQQAWNDAVAAAAAVLNDPTHTQNEVDDALAVLEGLPRTEPLKPLYGDADCNGEVTSADAAAVLRYTVKLQELSEQGLINGDVDGVPKVTSADAACILRWTVKIITVFPIEEMQP